MQCSVPAAGSGPEVALTSSQSYEVKNDFGVQPVGFLGDFLVLLNGGEAVGLVEVGQEPPGEHEEQLGEVEDLGGLAGVQEELVGGVAAVTVTSVLGRETH